jgi:hypothetical protein
MPGGLPVEGKVLELTHKLRQLDREVAQVQSALAAVSHTLASGTPKRAARGDEFLRAYT